MTSVSLAIVLAWIVLFGGAYVSRAVLGLGRRSSVAVVAGCYGLLCIPTLVWFGLTGTGLAAVTGLMLPCAAGIALVVVSSGRCG